MNIKYLLLSSFLVFRTSTGAMKRNTVGQSDFPLQPSVHRSFFVTHLVSFWTPQFRARSAWNLLNMVHPCWTTEQIAHFLPLPSPFSFSYSLVGLSLTNHPRILLDWLQILAFIDMWKDKEMYNSLNSIGNIISNNNHARKLAKMWYGQSYAPTQTE